MNAQDFNVVVEDLVYEIRKKLVTKSTEYNLDADKLGVFKRAAGIQQQTPEQALLGMMTKHIVSIYDYVEENKKFTEEMAREKITDALNYLVLLYALLKENGFKENS